VKAEGTSAGGRFIGGDPLRAMAALSVVLYHIAYAVATRTGKGWFEAAYGWKIGHLLAGLHVGLYLFFVLSGYLIAAPYVTAFIEARPLPSVKRYLRNRVVRIVPAFWLIFTILLLRHGTAGSSIGQIVAVYGFAQTYHPSAAALLVGPAWTLDIEVVFYAMVPIAAAVATKVAGGLSRSGRIKFVLASVVGVLAISLLLRAVGPGAMAWQGGPLAMMFAFMPGVLLAAIETTSLPDRVRSSAARLWAPKLLFTVGLALLAIYIARFPLYRFPQQVDVLGALLAAFGSGACVSAVLAFQWSTGSCWKWLDNPATRWIGKRSYSLYLVHTGIVLEFFPLLGHPGTDPKTRLLLVLAPVMAACLAAAALSYRLFELPFLRLRRAPSAPPTKAVAMARELP
jgi:peptidoglycan/LPS O-acetylase OafA/YrhL